MALHLTHLYLTGVFPITIALPPQFDFVHFAENINLKNNNEVKYKPIGTPKKIYVKSYDFDKLLKFIIRIKNDLVHKPTRIP